MLIFNWWFHPFLNWYLNIYVLTNKRIINVTHESIFKRQTTEAPINRVQDVTHKTLGIVSMIFNYGDVIIQTAGHQTLIHFYMVPNPRVMPCTTPKPRPTAAMPASAPLMTGKKPNASAVKER